MSDIVLSKGVRSNLLNLQKTADAISMTQGRLATGKKVNSALDNPTNFFTASSLNSRASDLSNLLDGLSNGIKTLEAADNGLKAITKTVESMQSTLRQARQDKSFKGQSFTVGSSPTGNISFSGGAVGTTPVSIALGSTPATATTLNGGSAVSTTAFAGGNVTINGTTAAIRGDQAAVATTLTGRSATFGSVQGGTFTINGTTVTVAGDQAAVSNDRAASGGSSLTGDPDLSALSGESITLTSGSNTVTYTFTGSATGQGGDLDTALNANGFTVTRGASGISISRADGAAVTVSSSNAAVNTALGQANGTFDNGQEANDATISSVLTDIGNAGITGLTATNDGGQIRLSLASGADITLGGTTGVLNSLGFDSANRFSDNGSAAFDATSTTVAADLTAAGVTGLTVNDNGGTIELSLASGADLTLGGDNTLLSNIGFAPTGRTSTNGTEAQVSTVDTIAAAINADSNLSGKVRASNDGGKLRIENLSTESLSVVGVDSTSVTGLTGSSNTQSIGGNEVRKNLISQFNELRTQLDKLSDDASFNGINLLRGDKLSLNFNETSTSKLDIQAKNAAGNVRGISTADNSLDIDEVDADVMQSDTNIDARLSKLGDSLTELRTQSSSFGSNLSVVQNRQEFTKATINTLKTGADNLTLADMNEEAANLLSLQTRQQLSNTALSLANQADQGVLRLF
jgi:flagellin-like hook-associated protein FlgL